MANYTFIVKPFLTKSYFGFEKPILRPYSATKEVNQSLLECNLLLKNQNQAIFEAFFSLSSSCRSRQKRIVDEYVKQKQEEVYSSASS